MICCEKLLCPLIIHTAVFPIEQPPDVRPIFEKSCYSCHGPKLQSANLRLDARPTKVIVPGNAADSILYQRIAGLGDQARMPMGGKPLDRTQIAIIKNWIDHGAEWPVAGNIQAASTKHWAFIPPARAPLTAVAEPRVGSAIQSTASSWQNSTLRNSSGPEANRTTLLRRLQS